MEGADDPGVNELRDRQIRNFLATLLLSQGTPMLLAGDEARNTQHGNNNAYCQDNELSWLGWSLSERDRAILRFTKRLLRLRAEHPVFRRSAFLTGEERQGSGAPDVWWFRPDGRKMTHADWARGDAFALGAFLNGAEIPTPATDGAPIVDDSFLVLFNSWREPVTFVLPPARFGRRWAHELCSADPELEPNGTAFPACARRGRGPRAAGPPARGIGTPRGVVLIPPGEAAASAHGGRRRRRSGRTATRPQPRGAVAPPRRSASR